MMVYVRRPILQNSRNDLPRNFVVDNLFRRIPLDIYLYRMARTSQSLGRLLASHFRLAMVKTELLDIILVHKFMCG